VSKARRRPDDVEGQSDSGNDSETKKEGSEWKLAGDMKYGRLLGLYKKYIWYDPIPHSA